MQTSNWKRRVGFLLLLGAAVGLLFWLRPQQRRAEVFPEVRPEPRVDLGTKGELRSPEPPGDPDALREPEADPPIIDEVTVEKSEVCEGEENLVTVRAHARDPRDKGYLRYVIAGQPGSQVAIKAYSLPADAPARMVEVIGRNNKTTTVEVPGFQVRNCKVAHSIFITMGLLPNTADEYEFTARIKDANPRERFNPVSFSWDFGDKMVEDAHGPIITHRFEMGDEDSLLTRFLVTVRAYDAKGNKLIGRLQANLPNPEFENLKYKGLLVLTYSMNPRFPKMDDAGVVEQKVRIWHHQPYPVKLRHVTVSATLSKDQGTIPLREVDPVDLLGTSSVPSSGIEATIKFDTKINDNIAMIDYLVTGEAANGAPAVLRFSIMKPPALPTRESAIAVTDAILNAKILKARELLNQEFVTDEDLVSLERKGAFEGLEADRNFKAGVFGAPRDLATKPHAGATSNPVADPAAAEPHQTANLPPTKEGDGRER